MGAVLQQSRPARGGLGRTRGHRRAVAAGDADRAAQLMQQHGLRAAENLAQRLDGVLGAASR
jgi:DNA-binding GntR family transcriptional regulator